MDSLKRVLVANVTEGKSAISAAQARDLARKSGVRDSADTEFFWSRLSNVNGGTRSVSNGLGKSHAVDLPEQASRPANLSSRNTRFFLRAGMFAPGNLI